MMEAGSVSLRRITHEIAEHLHKKSAARRNIIKHLAVAYHVFANVAAAETWLQENDPEGVAFEYEVME